VACFLASSSSMTRSGSTSRTRGSSSRSGHRMSHGRRKCRSWLVSSTVM
jgi:hypothetical protein